MIDTILSNEKYIGNVIAGKTFTLDFPNNQRKINKGEHLKYLATEAHPPIIPQIQFTQIQAEKDKRNNVQFDGDIQSRKSSRYSMKKFVNI